MSTVVRESHWLPPGKSAAVVFSIDDVHPGTSTDPYEAGGDLADGALGRAAQLLRAHAPLKLSLCVTPDWRLNSLVPNTRLWRHIPWLRNRVHWTKRHPEGHFRLDRHPQLVSFLNGLERCEVLLHGYTHSHRGPRLAVEFQDESVDECAVIIRRGLEVFASAHLNFARGFAPPAWNAPPALITALDALGFNFLISARDLDTAVSSEALTAGSGLQGVSLIHPQFVGHHGMVHLSTNFQATSTVERAVSILELGGVLHIKAHIFKSGGGHTMRDGLDDEYCGRLAWLFATLHDRFGDAIWWAHLSEVADRVRLRA